MEQDNREKNVIVIGPVGHGKSWFLNQVIGDKKFAESTAPSGIPFTKGIKTLTKKVILNGQEFRLNLTDTPGLNDSSQEAIDQLDQILHLVRSQAFDQIMIIVKYAELTPLVLTSLEMISLCLNSQKQSSTTLVLNQIPPKANVNNLAGFCDDIKNIMECDFFNIIYLKNGEKFANQDHFVFAYPDQSNITYLKSFGDLLLESNPSQQKDLKTWTELKKIHFYLAHKKDRNKNAIKRLENEVSRIESDIRWYQSKLALANAPNARLYTSSVSFDASLANVEISFGRYLTKRIEKLKVELREKQKLLRSASSPSNTSEIFHFMSF